MTRLLGILTIMALALGPAASTASAEDRRAPTREQWLKDVNKAMRGSGAALRERARSGDTGLAINLDIDNSSITTYYDGTEASAIPRILKLARVAERLDIALVFNTGRRNDQRSSTLDQLTGAGYAVASLCMRKKGEGIRHSKQRCRNRFDAKGWTLIANVGNSSTDFLGDGYERAYRLPNYGVLG